VLSEEQLGEFLATAPDNDEYLIMKVAASIAVCGCLREQELAFLDWSKVVDEGLRFRVMITHAKNTGPAREVSKFITNLTMTSKLKLYCSKFPETERVQRFFRKIDRSGHGTRIVVGKNTLATYPRRIAEFLGLEDADKFTGHCFRRTGATLLARNGASVMQLQTAGGWQSATVAQRYVAESDNTRLQIADRVFARGTAVDGSASESGNKRNYRDTNGATFNTFYLNVDNKNSRHCTVHIGANGLVSSSGEIVRPNSSSTASGVVVTEVTDEG